MSKDGVEAFCHGDFHGPNVFREVPSDMYPDDIDEMKVQDAETGVFSMESGHRVSGDAHL